VGAILCPILTLGNTDVEAQEFDAMVGAMHHPDTKSDLTPRVEQSIEVIFPARQRFLGGFVCEGFYCAWAGVRALALTSEILE